jgi:hypothetical protein
MTVGFDIHDGSTGTNVGPMLPAPADGQLSRCVVVVKNSDTTDCQFTIRQNGASVFVGPLLIPGGTASGSLLSSASLTTSPLAVARDDVFSIDIVAGSSTWQFTAQLE